MLLHEKLRRLIKPYKRTVICRVAGITFATLRSLVDGAQQPTLETARKLADTLGVELGWLVDDSKGWPPVRQETRTIDQLAEEPAAA